MASEEQRSDTDSDEQEQPRGRPPWMQSRIGQMPGGASPIDSEDIPEWAWNSPEYWYARYVELEKSYRDLGQIHQRQNMHHGNTAYQFAREAANDEELLDELLGLASIAVSVATLLFALRARDYHSFSTGVILGLSFVSMVLANRVHLPQALGRIRSTLSPPYGDN